MRLGCTNRFFAFLLLACLLPVLSAAAGAEYETVVREGLAALNSNDLATARQKLERASELQPQDPRIWLALAQTYFKANEPQRADAAAAKAAALAPDDPVTHHGLAIYHAAAGHWQQAGEWEERFARRRSGDSEALGRAAEFYLRAKAPQRAVELLRWGIANENRAPLQIRLAQALITAGMPKEATEPFEQAIRLQPYEERLYFELARLLLQLQDADQALGVLDRGRKIFDKSPQLELLRGIAFYAQRKFAGAVDSFLRSAALDPALEQPHAFLGRILSHAHDRLPEVTVRFASFEKANPENYLGYYLHAIALLEAMGPALDPEVGAQAERLLARAVELNAGHADSHFELGVLLAKERDFERAATHLVRAVELNPKSSKAHYHLARVYTRLGKGDQARSEQELHEKLTEQERQAMRSGMGLASESAFSDVVQ
jgi:tetratricopeptide (TPR) repeat protein